MCDNPTKNRSTIGRHDKEKNTIGKTKEASATSDKSTDSAHNRTAPNEAGPKETIPSQAVLADETAVRLLNRVRASLDDDQAEGLVVIDLTGKSDIADFMVIASGRSQRHVGAMAVNLLDRLKAAGHHGLSMEGGERADWVLIDAGDVIVHLFRPEVRSFYGLEKMWGFEVPSAAPREGDGAYNSIESTR